MPETKRVMLSNLKIDDKAGTFTAIFSRFGVVDTQGDLTLPGAFGEQRVIISAYGHGSWNGALPVGKGRIFESDIGGIVEGQFFLDTQAGAETYKTIKNVGDLQEWSYALPEIDYEMREQDGQRIRVIKRVKVNEVSPVLLGAGIGTQLLDIKGDKTMTPHEGESESAFMHRCMAENVDAGRDQEQASAICHRAWEGKSSKTSPSRKSIIELVDDACTAVRAAARGAVVARAMREADGKGLSKVKREHLERLRAELRDADSKLAKLLAMPVERDASSELLAIAAKNEERKHATQATG